LIITSTSIVHIWKVRGPIEKETHLIWTGSEAHYSDIAADGRAWLPFLSALSVSSGARYVPHGDARGWVGCVRIDARGDCREAARALSKPDCDFPPLRSH